MSSATASLFASFAIAAAGAAGLAYTLTPPGVVVVSAGLPGFFVGFFTGAPDPSRGDEPGFGRGC